jgi:hypothetical protein
MSKKSNEGFSEEKSGEEFPSPRISQRYRSDDDLLLERRRIRRVRSSEPLNESDIPIVERLSNEGSEESKSRN